MNRLLRTDFHQVNIFLFFFLLKLLFSEETPESRLRRVSGMKRNQKFRPPRSSNSTALGGDQDMRKKTGRYWRPF